MSMVANDIVVVAVNDYYLQLKTCVVLLYYSVVLMAMTILLKLMMWRLDGYWLLFGWLTGKYEDIGNIQLIIFKDRY